MTPYGRQESSSTRAHRKSSAFDWKGSRGQRVKLRTPSDKERKVRARRAGRLAAAVGLE